MKKNPITLLIGFDKKALTMYETYFFTDKLLLNEFPRRHDLTGRI